MKILMLVNWKIKYCDITPDDKQSSDYYVKNEPYWFFRYFKNIPEVDVIDISSIGWLEDFEKNKIRFYIWQTLKAIPKLNKYDIIISHGMQSGVVLSFLRRIYKIKAKHVVFDIGSFNSASESGVALKLMQFSSKSIDGIIYHTSNQIEYYKKFYPWVVDKSKFIKFGTDLDFFKPDNLKESKDKNTYIICVGYSKRDWNAVIKAYKAINTNIKLRLVGHVEDKFKNINGVEQLPYVPINDLINQIYNAKFCVLPLKSFNYSYGQMTLMQQMALGKCVVTANVPSLVGYFQDGQTALCYESGNDVEIKKKIEWCLRNEERVVQIGLNAKAYLSDFINESLMAKNIEEFLKSVNL